MNHKRRIERLEHLAAERQRQAPAAGGDVFADIRRYTESLARGERPPESFRPWLEEYDAEIADVAAQLEKDRADEQISPEDLRLAGF